MTNIRKNVFETNSSSVHTICIAKDFDYNGMLPKHITFNVGGYGWGYDCLSCILERASYLYTAVLYFDDEEKFNMNHIVDVLNGIGVECTVVTPDEHDDYYIDHCCELYDWLNTIYNDDTMLINYLFCDKSHVIIDNDNKFYDNDNIDDIDDDDDCKTKECEYYTFIKSN